MSDVTDRKDPAVISALETVLEKVNNKLHSSGPRIKNFAILPQDFSIKGGELGK